MVGYGAAGCILIMAMGEIISLIMYKDIRAALLLCALLCIGFISAFASTDRGIIVLCVLLIASVGKDMKTILRISIVLGVAMMIAAYFASVNGYIPYLVYDQSRGELYHAFGCVYRTDFAAHIKYLTMSYLWLSWSQWFTPENNKTNSCFELGTTNLGDKQEGMFIPAL